MRRTRRPWEVLIAGLLGACAGGSANPGDHPDLATEPPPPDMALPSPERLVEGSEVHLITVQTVDTVLAGRGPRPAVEQEPWPALLRVPVAGGAAETLAEKAFRLVVQRGDGKQEPTQLAYMTPQKPEEPPNVNRSLGDVFVVRPGAAPQKVTPRDAALMILPLALSPDGRYLLSHGRSLQSGYWFLDLTDLQTGRSRRLCWTLAAAVPRWLGFEGGGARYLALRNVYTLNKAPNEEVPPDDANRMESALLRVDVENVAPLALPGVAVALLPDGRVLTAGDKLKAVDGAGVQSDVAPGPVLDYSAFVIEGVPYYVKNAVVGVDGGPLLRVEKTGALTTLLDTATYLWFAGGTKAYVSKTTTMGNPSAYDMWAVPLAGGAALQLATDVARYRPLPGGGVLVFSKDSAALFPVGATRAEALPGNLLTVVLLAQERLVAIERGTGALRLGRRGAADGGLGPPIALGVSVVDGVEREPGGQALIYSVPTAVAGQTPGLYKQRL